MNPADMPNNEVHLQTEKSKEPDFPSMQTYFALMKEGKFAEATIWLQTSRIPAFSQKDVTPEAPRQDARATKALIPTLAVKPERRQKGIVPAPFVMRTKQRMQDFLPGLMMPTKPGLVSTADMTCLPTLEPERREIPALLTLFDAAGGEGLVHMRIFVEALLSVPANTRAELQQVGPFTIGEIAGDWLQWNRKHYRATGTKTGKMLRRALDKVHSMAVPINDEGGLYYPLFTRAIEGSRWEHRVSFLAQLPPGAKVGPPIDRNMLRLLGKKSSPAYRAYLSLCFDWDYYGGHRGRLIRPTRPEVKRHKATGALLNSEDRIIVGKVVKDRKNGSNRVVGNLPAKAWNDPRAIPTGRREPNPAAAERYHRLYEADDLVHLCYPAQIYDDPATRRKMRYPAKNAIRLIEKAGGCVIEQLGNKGKIWRILPPDLDM